MRLSDRLRVAIVAAYFGAALWCSYTSQTQALKHAAFIYWERGKSALAYPPYWLGRSRMPPSWKLPDDAGFLPWFPPDLPILAAFALGGACIFTHRRRRAGREGTPVEPPPETLP